MCLLKAGSNVGDFNTGVGMHGAAFGSRDGLNSGLPGQGAAVAVAAVTSFHRVTVCPQPQRALDNEKAPSTQMHFHFQHLRSMSSHRVDATSATGFSDT